MKKQRVVRSILICFVFIFAVALQSHVVSAKKRNEKECYDKHWTEKENKD